MITGINLINYNTTPNLIEYREIPILITITLFIYSILRKEFGFLIYSFLGVLSVLVYFWSVDRALIQNIFLIFILSYLYKRSMINNLKEGNIYA